LHAAVALYRDLRAAARTDVEIRLEAERAAVDYLAYVSRLSAKEFG
jgi:hypothetical protein